MSVEFCEGQWALSVEVLGVVLDVVAHEGVDEEVTVVIALVRENKQTLEGLLTLHYFLIQEHTHACCVSLPQIWTIDVNRPSYTNGRQTPDLRSQRPNFFENLFTECMCPTVISSK